MTAAGERAQLLRQIRASLAELVADGVHYVPAAARHTLPRTDTSVLAGTNDATFDASAKLVHGASADGDPRALGLAEIRSDLGECKRCTLCEKRTNIVFGEGSASAAVVFVGEGPGADEDRTGRPFVGRAGELLTKMIEACGWRREEVYICNVVKCRPPGNRDPAPEEIAACRPFLERQLERIAPRAIVTLGKPAASTLLGEPVAITRMRGRWREWRGIPLMPTYHPAYVLRNYTRETRQEVWDDLRAVHARLHTEG